MVTLYRISTSDAAHLLHEGGHICNVHAQLQAAVRQPLPAQCVIHVRATCSQRPHI